MRMRFICKSFPKSICFSLSRYLSSAVVMDDNMRVLRVPYEDRQNTFLEKHLVAKEPIAQFHAWFQDAKSNTKIIEPNAVCLSTATRDGIPSGRFVLCKGYDKRGFTFFTNYESRKANELKENPNAAMTFYWDVLHRSVRIEGTVEKLPEKDGTDYFYVRPVPSQIGAAISHQSKPIPSRDVLVEKGHEMEEKYVKNGLPVPKPDFWGGYILIPRSVEFWQGQRDRVHDRIKFRKLAENESPDGVLLHRGDDGWVYERLSP